MLCREPHIFFGRRLAFGLLHQAAAEMHAAVPRLPKKQIRRRDAKHVRKHRRQHFGDERFVAHVRQRQVHAEIQTQRARPCARRDENLARVKISARRCDLRAARVILPNVLHRAVGKNLRAQFTRGIGESRHQL